MSGSEGSSTKQSTSRVSQGRLYGALEEGATRWFVTTADARIFYMHQKKITNPRLCQNRRGFLIMLSIIHWIDFVSHPKAIEIWGWRFVQFHGKHSTPDAHIRGRQTQCRVRSRFDIFLPVLQIPRRQWGS